jgi:hypothetical protein
MKNKLFLMILIVLTAFQSAYAGGQSTFGQMKDDVSRGGWEVIWSESYGFEKAGLLAACTYFGCAQEYLKHELGALRDKVGVQLIEQALRNKGGNFGSGNIEIQAGTAYFSTWYRVPITREKVTTARYVRLYVKYRRVPDTSSTGRYFADNGSTCYTEDNNRYCCFRSPEHYRAHRAARPNARPEGGVSGLAYTGVCPE